MSNTLGLLEKRIANSEDKMFEVLNYIKDHDVSIRPKLVPNYPTFVPSYSGRFADGPVQNVSEPGYIIRPQMENLNLNSGTGTHDSYPSPSENNYRIAEGLKSQEGGDDFFRSTNIFAQQPLSKY